MKFYEKRTLEKRKKFEKELRAELSKWGSAHLKSATANFVHHRNDEGTPEHFARFILAAKFGEANSHVAIGTWKEFVIDAFNTVWNPAEIDVNEYGFRGVRLDSQCVDARVKKSLGCAGNAGEDICQITNKHPFGSEVSSTWY